ncbi:PREDICTED: uncharacterized protein LOC108554527, partial [Eufriesea mexicana]|uniref:uncharacterized protein LOC108554527 n=1 Tax=Eufriesea mexicana TaxID=516756 RepID=UPI00083BFF87
MTLVTAESLQNLHCYWTGESNCYSATLMGVLRTLSLNKLVNLPEMYDDGCTECCFISCKGLVRYWGVTISIAVNDVCFECSRTSVEFKSSLDWLSKCYGVVLVDAPTTAQGIQASRNNNMKLNNVLHVPELNSNFLSVATITDHGYDVYFNRHGATVYNKLGGIQMTAVSEQNSCYLRISINLERTSAVSTVSVVRFKRLGHANEEFEEEIKRKYLSLWMGGSWKEVCETYVQGKECKEPHPRHNAIWTKRALELQHTHLIGPIKPSIYGKNMVIQLLRDKSEAAEELKGIIELRENQTELRLRRIRPDKRGEYLGKKKSEQDVRRNNLDDVGRFKIEPYFLVVAVNTAVYIRAYLISKGGRRKKIEVKNSKDTFVGSNEVNIYGMYIPERENIRCDSDVWFDEGRNGSDLFRYKEDEDENNGNVMPVNFDVEKHKGVKGAPQENSEDERQLRTGMSDDECACDEESSDYMHVQVLNLTTMKIRGERAGNPKNVTEEAIIVKEYLRKRKQGKLDEQSNVRMFLMIRNQRAMRSVEGKIPTTITGARQSPEWDQWRVAIRSAMESLLKHQFWHAVARPFLHGALDNELYTEMTDGIRKKEGHICKLKDSIYDLKEARRCWIEYLTCTLIQIGLKQCVHGQCQFLIREGSNFLFCGIHVDDMIVVSSEDLFE